MLTRLWPHAAPTCPHTTPHTAPYTPVLCIVVHSRVPLRLCTCVWGIDRSDAIGLRNMWVAGGCRCAVYVDCGAESSISVPYDAHNAGLGVYSVRMNDHNIFQRPCVVFIQPLWPRASPTAPAVSHRTPMRKTKLPCDKRTSERTRPDTATSSCFE